MNAPIGDEVARVDLRHDEGVVTARQRTRDVAELLGFDRLEQTRIATAVSEIARNAFRYAGGGTAEFALETSVPPALKITVRDQGQGIANLAQVLSGRYQSSTGMGMGIVGSRRLMDRFEIQSEPGKGTVVELAQILPPGVVAPDTPKPSQNVRCNSMRARARRCWRWAR